MELEDSIILCSLSFLLGLNVVTYKYTRDWIISNDSENFNVNENEEHYMKNKTLMGKINYHLGMPGRLFAYKKFCNK